MPRELCAQSKELARDISNNESLLYITPTQTVDKELG